MDLFRKLFLVKEIVSKEGIVHFRRYRILQTPWFSIYLHNIRQSDLDKHFHDHPWNFKSLILRGSYKEYFTCDPHHQFVLGQTYTPGNLVEHRAEDSHKIVLLTPEVWTLVFVFGPRRDWGYQTEIGFINHRDYRRLKDEGKLP